MSSLLNYYINDPYPDHQLSSFGIPPAPPRHHLNSVATCIVSYLVRHHLANPLLEPKDDDIYEQYLALCTSRVLRCLLLPYGICQELLYIEHTQKNAKEVWREKLILLQTCFHFMHSHFLLQSNGVVQHCSCAEEHSHAKIITGNSKSIHQTLFQHNNLLKILLLSRQFLYFSSCYYYYS